MDFLSAFRRETQAFEAGLRQALDVETAPPVPSCPGWSLSDLAGHLGGVHRFVARILRDRLQEMPDISDLSLYELPADLDGWPRPENAPNLGPVPKALVDWFTDGAAALEARFRNTPPDTPVWTWAPERTAAFWLRIQAIEAAVHRWDAQGAFGTPQPVDTDLAVDAISHNFTVMAPFRRARRQAPPGAGERYGFRRTDGAGRWTVTFEDDAVRLGEGAGEGEGEADTELAGTASDLLLFLWHRLPAEQLDVSGDQAVLDRYFTLVPPL
ncbi:maleylpyruvate isomerase family mycothiol-dependent enzyme [Streptomyces gamaensis]|uniref:Maleylpyruvate isomerase family mycothiol-dependent enzyme n=1 Tax=Streptomyces gamaensis TaxID=1763542 RepID=A0ABW0Z0G2_9ACTN